MGCVCWGGGLGAGGRGRCEGFRAVTDAGQWAPEVFWGCILSSRTVRGSIGAGGGGVRLGVGARCFWGFGSDVGGYSQGVLGEQPCPSVSVC